MYVCVRCFNKLSWIIINYPDEDNINFKNFWPADLLIIGKDIRRISCWLLACFFASCWQKPFKKNIWSWQNFVGDF